MINNITSQQRLGLLLLVWVYVSNKSGSKTEPQNNWRWKGPLVSPSPTPDQSRSGKIRLLRAVSSWVLSTSKDRYHNLSMHPAPVFAHSHGTKPYSNYGSLIYLWVRDIKICNGQQLLDFILQYKANEVLSQVEITNASFKWEWSKKGWVFLTTRLEVLCVCVIYF